MRSTNKRIRRYNGTIMNRICVSALLLLFPFFLYAADEAPSTPLAAIQARVTCYAPGHDQTMEGPFATSIKGVDGQSLPRTLDDFRLEKSKYVTLAANPMHYRKWYNLGTITYVSNLDYRTYTIKNVVGYVHDTGSAFKMPTCQKYKTCHVVYRKFDIAYGDYRKGGNLGLVNSSALCSNKDSEWTQIGGPLTTAPEVTAGAYVPQAAAGYTQPGGGQAQTIGQAYQSNQQTQGQYPQAMPSQQAQAVVQPGQYFNPQQAGMTSPAFSTAGMVPIGSVDSNAVFTTQSQPFASVGDQLKSLIQSSSKTPLLSSISIGKTVTSTPLTADIFEKVRTIIAARSVASTTTKGTTTVRVTPIQTFKTPAITSVSSTTNESSEGLLEMLRNMRARLLQLLHSLAFL